MASHYTCSVDSLKVTLTHSKEVRFRCQEITAYLAKEMTWTIGWLHYWTFATAGRADCFD